MIMDIVVIIVAVLLLSIIVIGVYALARAQTRNVSLAAQLTQNKEDYERHLAEQAGEIAELRQERDDIHATRVKAEEQFASFDLVQKQSRQTKEDYDSRLTEQVREIEKLRKERDDINAARIKADQQIANFEEVQKQSLQDKEDNARLLSEQSNKLEALHKERDDINAARIKADQQIANFEEVQKQSLQDKEDNARLLSEQSNKLEALHKERDDINAARIKAEEQVTSFEKIQKQSLQSKEDDTRRLSEQSNELEALRKERDDINAARIKAEEQVTSFEKVQKQSLQSKEDDTRRLSEQSNKLEALRKERDDINAARIKAEEQVAAFKEAQERSRADFKNLTNEMLKASTEELKKQSAESLKVLLTPLDTEIKDFKVQITGFKAINERMTSETKNLTEALTSNVKTQGNWGEFTLERILEESGLERGREYVIQGEGLELKNAEIGARQIPDVIIHLPDRKHLIIDSKVSLPSYMDYVNSGDVSSRSTALKAFLDSVRTHIKGLAEKRYQDIDALQTPDFVMMFMPIEASYFLLMQEAPDVLSMAWDKRVAIVCPSTLLPNLRTIGYLWRLQKQNENAENIARLGARIYDKAAGFVNNMEGVGKALDTAQSKYKTALSQLVHGRGNLLAQTEKLKKLGVRPSKKLPEDMLEMQDAGLPAATVVEEREN